MALSNEEQAFMREAEIALMQLLGAWHGIACEVDARKRMTIEIALLIKLLVLFARDGLKVPDEKMLTELLREVWMD